MSESRTDSTSSGFDPAEPGGDAGSTAETFYDEAVLTSTSRPRNAKQRAQLDARAETLVESCVRRDGDRLPFLTTDRAARDMDRIRAALGDDRLTYLGYSYGTLLGRSTPTSSRTRPRPRARRPVDPALDGRTSQARSKPTGSSNSLDLFLMTVHRPSCAFRGGDHPGAAYDALRMRIATPIPADPRRAALNRTLFDIGVTLVLLPRTRGMERPRSALAAADKGDGSQSSILPTSTSAGASHGTQ